MTLSTHQSLMTISQPPGVVYSTHSNQSDMDLVGGGKHAGQEAPMNAVLGRNSTDSRTSDNIYYVASRGSGLDSIGPKEENQKQDGFGAGVSPLPRWVQGGVVESNGGLRSFRGHPAGGLCRAALPRGGVFESHGWGPCVATRFTLLYGGLA